MALPSIAPQIAKECNQVVTRAVFLDRDGVLNANIEHGDRPVAPTSLAEFRLLRGAEEAVCRLKTAGFIVVVVTNQPDVATGRTAKATVEAMHVELRRAMPIDDIKICYHVDADQCLCRKPKPGMLLEAAAEWNLDLHASYLVGDRWRDVEAGRAAGCFTIFIDYDYLQDGPSRPDKVVHSLPDAVSYIMAREQSGNDP